MLFLSSLYSILPDLISFIDIFEYPIFTGDKYLAIEFNCSEGIVSSFLLKEVIGIQYVSIIISLSFIKYSLGIKYCVLYSIKQIFWSYCLGFTKGPSICFNGENFIV